MKKISDRENGVQRALQCLEGLLGAFLAVHEADRFKDLDIHGFQYFDGLDKGLAGRCDIVDEDHLGFIR